MTSHTTAASVRVRSGLSLSDQSNATLLHGLTKPAQPQSVREMEVLIEWWKRTFTKIMSGGEKNRGAAISRQRGRFKKKKRIAVAHKPPTQVPDKLHYSISASGRKHNRQECNKIKNNNSHKCANATKHTHMPTRRSSHHSEKHKLTDILCVASDVSAAVHIIAHVNEAVQDSAKTKFPHRFNLTSSHFIIHCSA